MIREHLRHYSTEEQAWRRCVAYWNTLSYRFEQGIKAEEPLFHFSTDSGWDGFINLRDWYSSFMPQQARMASISCTVEQLKMLFLNCDEPLTGLPPGLGYQCVESRGLVDSTTADETLFSCLLPRGRLWLNGKRPDAVPLPDYEGGVDIAHVPVTLFFEVGHSVISNRLLRKVRCGDVLLVQHVENKMKTHGETLAKFIRNEEGFMFETEDGDEYGEDNAPATEDEFLYATENNNLLPVDKIKIELGFVLQRRQVSLETLEGYYKGEILPCHIDAEKNIEITANGAIIARGELIWFNERFGVEIKELCHEVKNDPR